MRKMAIMLIAAAILATGCGRPEPRQAGMQISTDQGTWRLTSIDLAEFQQDGWSICIYGTEVSTGPNPRLERFILKIINTDDSRPLYIAPNEIWVTAPDNSPIYLGPSRGRPLAKNESWGVTFDPGIRAPDMAYPFSITVTVFRGPNRTKPQTAFLTLY